ncbi:MAG: hypothetical protein EBQ95_03455 [Gammaproteobacteria bacterium]|nr:hypothetical protein [Gammaproteobacteria bacterium]
MKKKARQVSATSQFEKKLLSYNISQESYAFHCDRLLGEGFSIDNIQHILVRKKGIERANKLFENYRILLDKQFTHAQICDIFALSTSMLTIQKCLDHIHEWLQKYSHQEIVRMTACTFSTGNIELLTQCQEQMEIAGYTLRKIPEILGRTSGYQLIRSHLDALNQQNYDIMDSIDLNDIEDVSFKMMIENQITPISRQEFVFFKSYSPTPDVPVDDCDVDFDVFSSLDY